MMIRDIDSLFFSPLNQPTTGLGDPVILQVSLMVCPIFVVQSHNKETNTGGPGNIQTDESICINAVQILTFSCIFFTHLLTVDRLIRALLELLQVLDPGQFSHSGAALQRVPPH